jgi:hypothetical protein
MHLGIDFRGRRFAQRCYRSIPLAHFFHRTTFIDLVRGAD